VDYNSSSNPVEIITRDGQPALVRWTSSELDSHSKTELMSSVGVSLQSTPNLASLTSLPPYNRRNAGSQSQFSTVHSTSCPEKEASSFSHYFNSFVDRCLQQVIPDMLQCTFKLWNGLRLWVKFVKCLHMIVKWVEVWWIWWPFVFCDEVNRLRWSRYSEKWKFTGRLRLIWHNFVNFTDNWIVKFCLKIKCQPLGKIQQTLGDKFFDSHWQW